MTLWRIEYDGIWLGGVAIVYAPNETEALITLRQDSRSHGAKNPEITPINILQNCNQIIFNDDGDY